MTLRAKHVFHRLETSDGNDGKRVQSNTGLHSVMNPIEEQDPRGALRLMQC